jgi:hypothetical protein
VNVEQNRPAFQHANILVLFIGICSGFDMFHWVILLVCSGHSFSGGKGEICGSGATLGVGFTVGLTGVLAGISIVTGMANLLFQIQPLAQIGFIKLPLQ